MTESSPRAALFSRISIAVVVLAVFVLVLGRLSSFGIWDPWELTAADAARHRLAGDTVGPQASPQLTTALVASGFSLFDVHEWSGRLPIAVAGLLALLVAFGLVSRTVDRRAGLYTVIAAASSPLFLLNARQMVGSAPGFLASTLVFAGAFISVFPPEGPQKERFRIVGLVGAAIAGALAVATSGALLGLAPPLVGVGAVVLARREELVRGGSSGRVAAGAVSLAAIATILMVVRAIHQNAEDYNPWIGSIPHAGTPPTFEVDIERVFHSFAPWSAVLPIAIGSLMTRASVSAPLPDAADADDAPRRDTESALGAAAVMWAAAGLAAETVFESRYGSAPFLPAMGLAIVVAIYLRTVERDGRGSWAAGLVTLLLAMLLVRDFAEYPGAPASGLALTDLVAPEPFNPRGRWAIVLCVFAALAFLGLAADRTETFVEVRQELRAPIALWQQQWARGPVMRGWMIVLAVLAAVCVGFGVLAWVVPEERPFAALGITSAVLGGVTVLASVARVVLGWLGDKSSARVRAIVAFVAWAGAGFAVGCLVLAAPGISSLGVRVGKVLLFVPFGVLLGYALVRGLRYAFYRLGDQALAPMMAASLAFGGYVSLGFEPELSQHFSPREIYDTYNALAHHDEPLGEYRVGGRAAAYYAQGPVEEVADENAAVSFLMREGRVWLAFRADDLAALDRAYRRRTAVDGHPGHHLYVADARSARVLLATNSPIEGRADENYLVGAILDAVPATMQHQVHCNFDRRVELVGYDLDSPRPDTAGPGQQFTITWYWRSIAPVPSGYQIFLHVDGYGQRLNGDHEPVDGHYPVRLWDTGDIVVDHQQLRVPANFPAGDYQYFIGFYSGESRLEILEGREDDVNRCIAGTIHVR
jgi:4-amino-4-deoxy-L-arabinose transferase-like glycosyltransferase